MSHMRVAVFSFALIFGFIGGSALSAHAAVSVRWTGFEDRNAALPHVLEKISQLTKVELSPEQLMTVDDRDLAREHFQMFAQTRAGIPIRGKSLRIWKDMRSGKAVQVEADLEDPAAAGFLNARSTLALAQFAVDLNEGLSSQATLALVRARLVSTEDPAIRAIAWTQEWDGDDLVRVVKVRARRGKHEVRISLRAQRVVEHAYREFPQADIPAQVWPIYEQSWGRGQILPRVTASLKNLQPRVARVTQDPYGPLREQHYLVAKLDPLLGLTEAGRLQGYWSPSYVRAQAEDIRRALPQSENSFEQGVVLEGLYATVSLDPAAVAAYPGIDFKPELSSHYKPDYRPLASDPTQEEMVFANAYLGKPIRSAEDAWNRVARRLPDHDPTTYINDGFDEIQVYYAVNQLFESLRPMGFTDPELSTRPFNAFLFIPNIEWQNNAFYTDDTINFTTYSADALNMTRDNPTIWHELGHGIMERLMGEALVLADTGGLSEGMADFIAAIVVADVTKNEPFDGSDQFRIVNRTAFHLTNEVHDDGESYGGAMNDLLQAAIARDGQAGVAKVADLTLEAMRLSRNHPALTAQVWFTRMLFADQIGTPGVRAPGDLKPLIENALLSRNFSFEGTGLASFSLQHVEQEITADGPGSRGAPIRVGLKAEETADFPMSVSLKNGEHYQFKFPVEVKVVFRPGPLQGAIHWEGEEAEPLIATLQSEADVARLNLRVRGTCDWANREDGSCVDFAYFQIWNSGEDKPVAKKRFYLRVKTAE